MPRGTSRPCVVDDAQLDAVAGAPGRAQLAELAALGRVVVGRVDGRQRREFGHAVGLHEADAGQRGHRAVEHRLGDRRGAVDDGLQRAQVARLLHRRVIDEHLDHGRHEQHMGDAVALEGVEHELRD